MGAITGTQIVSRARDLVQDVQGVRWLDPENLTWLNEGINYAVRKRPALYVRAAQVSLDASSPKQTLTIAGAFAVLDVPYNVDGANHPARAIRRCTKLDIENLDPAWTTRKGDDVRHWMPGPEAHTFYVYPALPKTSGLGRRVEIHYAATPTPLATLSTVIPFDDVWADVLTNYLLFRLYSKDAEHAANEARASTYLTLVNTSLGE